VPYECKGNKTLFVLCKGDQNIIKKYLAVTPFEYISDLFVISISDFTNSKKLPLMDCGLIFPVKYKNLFGGYYMFEYEDHEYAIAAGRDLWGYPKKYGKIDLIETNSKIRGTVKRNNKVIIDITCDLSKKISKVERPKLTPHLNIHVIPKADGPGIFSMRIISRDTSPDFELISERYGESTVTMDGLSTDPLNEFAPLSILGGGFTVGNFLASEKNGWGKVIATLI
jgi:acetoacetate decarboxylase